MIRGAELTVERTAVRDTMPRSADGRIGRGISVQSQEVLLLPSNVSIRQSLVERSHESGILIEGSTAVIEDTVVRETRAQQAGGVFGDTIWVVSMVAPQHPATATITRCEVADGPQVGIASFGGSVSLGESQLTCNAIDLNGMDTAIAPFEFVDTGGNECGCQGTYIDCRVLADDLEPPRPTIPTL